MEGITFSHARIMPDNIAMPLPFRQQAGATRLAKDPPPPAFFSAAITDYWRRCRAAFTPPPPPSVHIPFPPPPAAALACRRHIAATPAATTWILVNIKRGRNTEAPIFVFFTENMAAFRIYYEKCQPRHHKIRRHAACWPGMPTAAAHRGWSALSFSRCLTEQ